VRDQVIGCHERCLRVDHHDDVIADDGAGIWIAFGCVGVKPGADLVERFFLAVSSAEAKTLAAIITPPRLVPSVTRSRPEAFPASRVASVPSSAPEAKTGRPLT